MLTIVVFFSFSGPHRPLWAAFGEYEFLPLQRWIHNLEHGGIVALYHPCANSDQVYDINIHDDFPNQ